MDYHNSYNKLLYPPSSAVNKNRCPPMPIQHDTARSLEDLSEVGRLSDHQRLLS